MGERKNGNRRWNSEKCNSATEKKQPGSSNMSLISSPNVTLGEKLQHKRSRVKYKSTDMCKGRPQLDNIKEWLRETDPSGREQKQWNTKYSYCIMPESYAHLYLPMRAVGSCIGCVYPK